MFDPPYASVDSTANHKTRVSDSDDHLSNKILTVIYARIYVYVCLCMIVYVCVYLCDLHVILLFIKVTKFKLHKASSCIEGV